MFSFYTSRKTTKRKKKSELGTYKMTFQILHKNVRQKKNLHCKKYSSLWVLSELSLKDWNPHAPINFFFFYYYLLVSKIFYLVSNKRNLFHEEDKNCRCNSQEINAPWIKTNYENYLYQKTEEKTQPVKTTKMLMRPLSWWARFLL